MSEFGPITDEELDAARVPREQWGWLAELRKDAERYRWLRDKCNHVRVGVHIQFSSKERDADSAIDAAMNGANTALSRPACRGRLE